MSRSNRRQVGFTLIELMVALVVGGIFIGAVYGLGAATSRHFYGQHTIASTQTSLRHAMSRIKKDIARAGYLGTPNAAMPGETCGLPDNAIHDPAGFGALAAISHFTNRCAPGTPECAIALDATALNVANNVVEVDSLVLSGNYSTAAAYPQVDAVGSNQIAIWPHSQAFQRDFTNWFTVGALPTTLAPFNADLFNDAFLVGRAIAVHSPRGFKHFATITAVVQPGAQNERTLVSFLPGFASGCQGEFNGGMVSPLNFIRYHVEPVDNPLGQARSLNSLDVTGPVLQLVREELNPRTKTKNESFGNERIVADFVVDFDLRFLMANRTGPSVPDTLDLALKSAVISDVNNNPELVRSVLVRLSLRTPREDRRLLHQGTNGRMATGTNPHSASGYFPNPLLTYDVFPTRPGVARVRSLEAEIFVPNVAFRGF